MLPLGRRCSWAAAWPRGAKPYPLLEIGHRLFAELLFRRHLQVRVGVFHRLDEQAFVGVSGRDGRAGVAALYDCLAGGQQQVALVLLRVVTLETIVREERPDFVFKKLDALRRERRHLRLAKRHCQRGESAKRQKNGSKKTHFSHSQKRSMRPQTLGNRLTLGERKSRARLNVGRGGQGRLSPAVLGGFRFRRFKTRHRFHGCSQIIFNPVNLRPAIFAVRLAKRWNDHGIHGTGFWSTICAAPSGLVDLWR